MMEFTTKVTDILAHRTDCAVIPIFDSKKLPLSAKKIDDETQGVVRNLLKQGDIKTKVGSTLLIPHLPTTKFGRLLLVGMGKLEDLNEREFRSAVDKVAKLVKSTPAKDTTLFFDGVEVIDRDPQWQARYLTQSFLSCSYQFNQYKSESGDKPTLKKVTLASADRKSITALKKGIALGKAIATGMHLAKDLGNLPGNVCTPNYLAKQARSLARGSTNLKVKILDEKQMRELKMGSFLSVTAGTEEPAKMIVMEYSAAAKTKKPIVLVGKGITFDTGGISLKPGAAMDEMKFDMCGAASVFGAMKALVDLQLPLNVIAIIAAAENMPSGTATKPGDIVTSMAGKTIEVLNTDAEGRLVLCDALTYAQGYNPQTVIDVATLTGACVIALGKHATGLYSNRDALAEELLQAGKVAGDKAWHMPLWEEYQKQLDSNFADIANIGGRDAGSVTAACFLARFTEDCDWAHLDIAGTAWLSGSAKGATGRPVPLLVEFLNQRAGL